MHLILSMGIDYLCSNIKSFVILLVLILFVISYFFIPFDLIDDSIGFLGYLDDFIIVLGLSFGICEYFMNNFRRNNENNGNNIVNNHENLINN